MLRADIKHVCGSLARVSVMVGRGGVARMPEPVASIEYGNAPDEWREEMGDG